ncbi:hypothetical protein CPHO_05970 [Corynebacterium phocae]|uniref:Uncharacterized protein n=1 Tax=Corynebacterium phocae TaxID=161895 RepID=A0A1L7D3K9_9CORY|nr:hypothetical protein [Corynebacterium phocae]APT92512.1 hypothetical protein CPHO_05970 [Corynebacterium phocae]KAA8725116.1 hypothetical protein F4V58_05510 [Corynebacterium phocae]
MDMRAEVWSPLQNASIWLGAWLFGLESTDELIDALTDLGGYQTLEDGRPLIDLLSSIRSEVGHLPGNSAGEPLLRLVLSGPGEPPALPASSPAFQAAAKSLAGAIIVKTAQADRHLVLVPTALSGEGGHAGTGWQLFVETGPLPAPAWLSPGDADFLLARATEESAAWIEKMDYVKKDTPSPRLQVGSLADFYENPGLPAATPVRSEKLFSRADRVAAIIETVTDRLDDHYLDPQLLRLWRHIRQARMAGVAYALTEFAR